MGMLHDRMQDDLKLKNYAKGTIAQYLRCAGQFVEHFAVSPLEVEGEAIRKYIVQMAKKRSPERVNNFETLAAVFL